MTNPAHMRGMIVAASDAVAWGNQNLNTGANAVATPIASTATIMTLMCAGFVIGSAAPLVYSWNALATPGKTTLLLASFAAAWTVPIVAGFTDSASEVGAWGLGAAGVGVVVGYLLYARGVTQRGSTHLAGVMLLLISAVAIGMGAVESRALWVSRALAAAAVVLLWFLARDVFSGEDT